MTDDQKTHTLLLSENLEEVLVEARLRWPKKQLPPLTEREADALKSGAKIIPLSRGQWAIVDAPDYGGLAGRTWFAQRGLGNTSFYARRDVRKLGALTVTFMHREILPGCKEVDHVSNDGLDNRRSNLRPATHSQNQWNRTAQKNNTSGRKGVGKHGAKWRARIRVFGQLKSLGSFNTVQEAHAAYAEAARTLHRDFARVS